MTTIKEQELLNKIEAAEFHAEHYREQLVEIKAENKQLLAELESQKQVILKMRKALEHCSIFDTSGSRGEYEYGQIVNRRTPESGKRFKTPKEVARQTLKELGE